MGNKISIFKTPAFEAEYNSAYEAALRLWPVPYDKFYVPTRFGDTHVIASGSKEDAPLALFHPAGCGAPIWYRNVGAFSRHY